MVQTTPLLLSIRKRRNSDHGRIATILTRPSTDNSMWPPLIANLDRLSNHSSTRKLSSKATLRNTVLFDVPTQFSTNCAIDNFTTTPDGKCYAPVDYDNQFRGPMTLRDALAQSINVPSVKLMYLAGVQDSINLAESMGITSLGDPNQYGLTLVLGGGEVSLLDMTSAYGVFATEGLRNPYISVLEVDDSNGKVLEKATPNPTRVLDPEIAENQRYFERQCRSYAFVRRQFRHLLPWPRCGGQNRHHKRLPRRLGNRLHSDLSS